MTLIVPVSITYVATGTSKQHDMVTGVGYVAPIIGHVPNKCVRQKKSRAHLLLESLLNMSLHLMNIKE